MKVKEKQNFKRRKSETHPIKRNMNRSRPKMLTENHGLVTLKTQNLWVSFFLGFVARSNPR